MINTQVTSVNCDSRKNLNVFVYNKVAICAQKLTICFKILHHLVDNNVNLI